jgi:hypothetical protein
MPAWLKTLSHPRFARGACTAYPQYAPTLQGVIGLIPHQPALASRLHIR